MPYLIDGHNLIAFLPDIDLEDPNDEAKLVVRLKGFVARTHKKCTVVFDCGIPGGKSSMSTKSVRVIFAAADHRNADAVLKRRIRQARDARNWTVVSSDREVLDFARSHRMKQMSSTQFAQELQGASRAPEIRGEEVNPIVSDDEVDELLSAFGGEGDA